MYVRSEKIAPCYASNELYGKRGSSGIESILFDFL